MREDVRNQISKCQQCQRFNIMRHGFHPIVSIQATLPFDHVAIDLAGPLQETEEGNTMILILVDICSKFVILRPIENKKSETIAAQLFDIFCLFGFPKNYSK